VVRLCWMPKKAQVNVHMAAVTWVPLSVVTVAGTPKCATQLAMNAFEHMMASSLPISSASSTWFTCQRRSAGPCGPPKKQVTDPPGPYACGRICILGPEWRGVELLAFPAYSHNVFATPFQTNCADNIRLVAHMPGWPTLWMVWKISAL